MEYGLVAVWLVAYLVVGAAGLPVAAALLGRLADDGAGVALPLALAPVALVALWVGHVSFPWPALLAGVAVLAGLVAAAGRLGDAEPNWSVALETGAVFVVAFLFLVAVRAVDPAVHPLAGEKFLDFGLVKSLYRAETLPPADFWFAGEPVAYYYGGHLVTTLLGRATGTAPQYAYNLSLAGFYAMYVTAAFGVGGSLAAARGASRRLGGLLAAFFVGFASNLQTAGRVLVWALPDAVSAPVVDLLAGGVGVETAKFPLAPGEFRYWDASRVIEGTINEFPLFAFLNGDLHGHMTVTPFTLLLVALLFAYFRTPAERRARRRLLVFGATPAVGGIVAFTNTWSAASVFGLTALALLLAPADPTTLLPHGASRRLAAKRRGPAARELVRAGTAGVLAVGIEALALAWVLPFLLGSASGRSLALFPDRSSLGGLLVVHGAFLAVAAVYLATRVDLERDEWLLVAIAVAGVLLLATLYGAAAAGLFLPLVVGGIVLLRHRAVASENQAAGESSTANDADGAPGEDGVGFEVVLLVAATGLALLVEFVYVEEQAGPGRFNTVFKMYAQVWLFWATAAGAMLAAVVARTDGSAGAVRTLRGRGPSRRTVAAAFVAVLLASTSVYGGLALDNHFSGESMSQHQRVEDPTLNATDFVDRAHPAEAPAIRWVDSLEGQPTIVTRARGIYRWSATVGYGDYVGAAAPASLTGVPTVIGWPHHEIGFRSRPPVEKRVRHVQAIYAGRPAQQAELLRRYDVAYVYFGPAERAEYGELSGEVTIDDLPGVTLHREWPDVKVFRVNESALPGDGANG